MNFSDIYNHDEIAAEEGVWMPIGYGLKVKVRSFESSHTKALRAKLELPFKPLLNMGKAIPESDLEEINRKLVAYSSLLDWNLTEGKDENGQPNPIPFSPETAYELLKKQPRFARDVIAVLVNDETFKKRVREEDSKNF